MDADGSLPEPPAQSGPWVIVVAVLASSMAFIDGTALNVALPALQGSLGATGPDLFLVINAYALPLAALLLLGGSLGDHYGRRRVLAAGIALFAAASLACGLAPGIDVLVGARVVQGIGAALMIPGSLALLTAGVQAAYRGRAIGIWSACCVLVSALGPLVGGVLAQAGLWRGVFFLNLPLALLALTLLFIHVPESCSPSASARLDWAGALTATLGLAGLTFGLIEAAASGGQGALLALAAGALALLLFLVIEVRSADPLLPLGLFRSRVFRGANLLTLCLYTAFNGMLLFLPLNLIQVQGYSATLAGLSQLPIMVLLIVLSPWAGSLADRHGPRRVLVAGPLLAGLGFAGLALPGLTRGPADYLTHYLPPLAVLGVGMGLSLAPLSTTVVSAVPGARSGLASGINSTLARLTSVLAAAVLGTVAIIAFRHALAARAGELGVAPPIQAILANHAANLGRTQVGAAEASEADRQGDEAAVKLAFVDTFRLLCMLAAGLAWAGAVVAALHLPRRPLRLDTTASG
jgi:EmrB/QacA subfamily drug resistance transporter